MAAAGQIQLAVVSAAAGDRDSAYGTVISVAPSHCQSAFVLHAVPGRCEATPKWQWKAREKVTAATDKLAVDGAA
jgi:hypothetical protein